MLARNLVLASSVRLLVVGCDRARGLGGEPEGTILPFRPGCDTQAATIPAENGEERYLNIVRC